MTWPDTLNAADGFCNDQCFYDIGVAIDPNNAANIYVGGQTQGNCSRIFARSTDSGANFANSATGLHADTHVIAIAPSNAQVIYTGNDGGVWRSVNSGVDWVSRNNAGISATQFQSLALHPTDRNFLIGGTQDNGTEYLNPASVWQRVDGGDGGYALIDQNAADTTTVTMYHTYFNVTNSLIGFARATTVADATAMNWTFRGTGTAMGNCTAGNGFNCNEAVLFYAPMALGPGNPNTVYFGTDRLHRSTDQGDNNPVVSQTFTARISAIGISPQNDQVRIIGLEDGRVFVTTTGGNPLTEITVAALPDTYISRAAIDPTNANTAYITFSNYGLTPGQHIWKTTNLNAATPTWTAASGGIPDVPVNAFAIDPANTNILYAGTDIGAYQSCDGGLTWMPFGDSLPRVAIFDMAVQNVHRIVRIATHGRGIYEIAALPAQTDIAITKTDAPDSVVAGTNLTYTLTVKNNGEGCASNVMVSDTLPAQTTFVAGTTPANWTCNFPAVGSSGGTVSCTRVALSPGEQAVIEITVQVPSCVQDNASLSNTATVRISNTDTNTNNNSSTATTTVIRRADLALTMSDAPDPVIAGTNLTYTINVINNGPSCAANLTINDTIPANTRLVSATPSAGGAVMTTPLPAVTVTAVWAGDTAVGVRRTLTIVVRICPEVLCNTVISNTATTSSDNVDPNPGNNSATVTATVQTQSDIAITNTATPNPVIAGQNVTYTLNITNAGPSNSAATVVTDVLPKGFTVVSLNTTLGTITATATDPVTQQVTVTANLGVLGAANQCTTSFPTAATVTIVANVPMKYPVVIVTNAATVATGNCLPDPNLANNAANFDTTVFPLSNDPGLPIFATTEASDQKAGSVLVYNLYASSTTAPSSENTRINLTNISAHEDIAVHLFFVDGQTCSVADAYVCLTKNQTTSFLASDIDPGTRGYLLAVATDAATGLPRAFNCLIGDAYIKLSSGHQANLAAEAFSALMIFPAGSDPHAVTATLRFDGMSYNLAPRVLALDNLASRAEGNDTLLIINRFGGNLATGAATIGAIFGIIYDDAENALSFNFAPGVCQFRSSLSTTFPRTTPRLENFIPAGRTGWLKFYAAEDTALLGAALNHNPNQTPGAFSQGHNLHKLRLTNTATYVVPIIPSNCGD